MATLLEIRLFGGVRIKQGDALLGGFISAKAPALLAYLACNPGAHGRESLAGLLWGEMPEPDARNNLRQTLSNLRKKIGDHLIITRTHVGFDAAAPCWLDVEQFERRARDDAGMEALHEAAALYRGDFLAGFSPRSAPAFEEWMLAQRARYRELALWVLQRLTDEHLRRRELGRTIDAAARLLALDPWREEAHRQLMRALAYGGQRSAALAQFEKCRRVLYDELGVAPSLETLQLYERIRILGQGPTSNLPSSTTSFFGREQELAAIRSWATGKDSRLLTITGPGGVGKSRLALEAARMLTSDFLEGVWLAPLISVDEGASLASAVAASVDFQFTGDQDRETQLLHFLQEKEMLLVLDNLEHLLSPENLTWLTRLMAHSPDLKLLVTSRARLNLQAESILELGGLPFSAQGDGIPRPLSGAASPDVGQTPAGRLFLARARQVRPDFDELGQEGAMMRLCALVDGLPLAIELAATWMRAMELEDILAEIEKGVGFLRADRRDLPERHRSMQAVCEYSWRMLTPAEQDIYARLSVFRGGFSPRAAQAVTGASFRVLARLVDKSLLSLEDGRYTWHPMLRQFALEKLRARPARLTEARRAHVQHYARFIRQLEPTLFGGAVEAALRRLEPELQNLQWAWENAVGQRDLQALNALADGLAQIVDFFGLYREGRILAAQAVHALEPGAGPAADEHILALGRAHGLAAVSCVRLGECTSARAHAQKALQLLAPLRPHLAYAHSLVYAGAAAYSLGDLKEAAVCWRQGVEAYRAVGSVWGQCVALNNLSEAMLTLGRIDAARKHAGRAYTLALEMQNGILMATTRQVLAGAALKEGDVAAAESYAEDALRLHRRIGHRVLIAHTLVVLARIAEGKRDLRRAVTHLEESAAIFRQLGARTHLCSLLTDLGALALRIGHPETATTALYEACTVARACGEEALAAKAELLLEECSQV